MDSTHGSKAWDLYIEDSFLIEILEISNSSFRIDLVRISQATRGDMGPGAGVGDYSGGLVVG